MTTYEVEVKDSQRRCKHCGHRWNLHYQVERKGHGIKMVCDGEAFPCNCVLDFAG